MKSKPADPDPRRLMARLGLIVSIALVAALLYAGPAEAGSYVVAQCDPKRGSAHEGRFERTSSNYSGQASCRQGSRGIQISHAGRGTGDERYGAWSWRAPAGTVLRGLAADAHLTGAGGHAPQLVVGRSDGTATYFGEPAGRWLGEHWAGVNGTWFRARLRCYGGPDGVCDATTGPHVWLKRLRLTFDDVAAPSLNLGGTLPAAGVRRGEQRLTVAAADAGGGVQSIQVTVNGVAAAGHRSACALGYGMGLDLTPCPGSARRDFSLDTASAPFRNGENELRVCVRDLTTAGPANETCEARRIQVANDCPSSAAGGKILRASFRGGDTTVTARYGTRPRIAGVIWNRSGSPVPGARLCILERTALPGSPWRRAAMLLTRRPGGRFAWAPRPGPSRFFRIVHRHGSVQIERRLRLESRVAPRLAVASPRIGPGGRIRFRGWIPGPANAGRIVGLQAHDGDRWITFRSARTTLRGRFATAYRLRRTTGPARYRLRAVVRAQSGYPYERGVSRVVVVRVR